MTCVLGKQKVLEDFRNKQKEAFAHTSDIVVEHLFATSPIQEYPFSVSVEKQDTIVNRRPGHSATGVPQAQLESKTKTKTFDKDKGVASFVFAEQPAVVRTHKSLLTINLERAQAASGGGGGGGGGSAGAGGGGGGGGGAVRGADITLHLPFGKAIKIKIDEKATVEFLLTMLIRQFKSQMAGAPKNYIVRMAEEDGTPDDDFPPLNLTQSVCKFGKVFVVLPHPAGTGTPVGLGFSGDAAASSARDGASASTAASARASASGSGGGGGGGAPSHVARLQESKSGPATQLGRVNSSLGSSGGDGGKKMLKVYMPGEQGYLFVPWNGTMRIGQLLSKVCMKRMLDVSSHHFQMLDTPMAVDANLSFDDLGVTELKLCLNK